MGLFLIFGIAVVVSYGAVDDAGLQGGNRKASIAVDSQPRADELQIG